MPKKHHISFLLSAFLLMLFAGIYEHDLISRGEGREALVAQAILQDNEWILPKGYSHDVPSKPPFLHWLSAVISLPLGKVNDITVRLPSALLALSLVLLFYRFISKRFSERLAFYTSAVLFTSLEFYRAATVCRVDMVFSAMIFIGLLAFYKWKEVDFKGTPLLPIFFLSFATLCKGPAGLILPAGIFLVWLYFEKVPLKKIIFSILSVVIPAFLLSVSWYFAAYFTAGEPFLLKVYDENIARFLGNMDEESHQHNLFYLLGMYFLGLSPWTLILFIPFIVSLVNRRIKFRFATLDSFEKFALVSILTFLIFFSIPSSKRAVYLLPIYPFSAFFLAKFLAYAESHCPKLLARIMACVKLVILLVLLLVISFYIWHDKYSSLQFFQKGSNAFLLEIPKELYMNRGLLWIIPVFSLYFLLHTLKKRSVLNLICIFVLITASLQVLIIIPYSSLFSPKPFAMALNDRFRDIDKIYSYRNEFYSLSFYMQRRFYRFQTGVSLEKGILVIFEDKIEDTEKTLGRPPDILLESENYVEKPLKKLIAVK